LGKLVIQRENERGGGIRRGGRRVNLKQPRRKKLAGETLCEAWMPLQPVTTSRPGSAKTQISFPFNFNQT